MTTGKNILFFLVLVVAVALVHSKYASWGQGVFPDDPRWPSFSNRREFENSENDVETKKFKLCETAECKTVAEEFLGSMNTSTDPCEDFYEFSCGGWTADNAIPPSMSSWSRVMIFQNAMQYRIKEALETKSDPSDILPVRQAKKWYRSCMDLETLDQRGIKPIESILMQAGGWPISMDEEEWDAEEYTWQKVEREYLRITGSYVFYDVTTLPPMGTEPKKFGTLQFKAGAIPLSEQLPLKYRNYSGNDYETYVNLVDRAANLFAQHTWADVSKKKIRKEAEEIVEFEKEIYKLNEKNLDYETMTFEEFVKWHKTNATEVPSGAAPLLDWNLLIRELFDMVNIEILPSAEVAVRHTAYFRGIDELLRKTSTRTIVNYIHWKFVGNMMAYTTEAMRNVLFELVKEEYGVKERAPRWTECVNDVQMNHAAAYAFVAKFFTKSTEIPALEMIKNIRIELKDKIDKSNWLDEESKKLSKDKLDSMQIFVGFPDWYTNRTAVINLYKGLSIGADYFDNSLSYLKYDRKKNLRRYAIHPVNDDEWSIDPITVNALYNRNKNSINIPAVDFQSPLFTPGLPDYVNYGITGFLVGHEISHGFDINGIKVGKNGNNTELSKNILKAYYQRAECFLDQFEGYYGETTVPVPEGLNASVYEVSDELNRNYFNFIRTAAKYCNSLNNYLSQLMRSWWSPSKAMLTRGENMADTTGIQAVFQAYRKLKKPGGHSRLPGLEKFTDDQLFFLSFAAMWCEIGTPQYEEKREDKRDPHSPPRYRVIGAVSNTKDFARAFDCPEGSSMNPINKCDIWEKPGAAPESKPDCDDRNDYRWGGQWRH